MGNQHSCEGRRRRETGEHELKPETLKHIAHSKQLEEFAPETLNWFQRVWHIKAVKVSTAAAAGGCICGLIGFLFGPVGAAAGALLGVCICGAAAYFLIAPDEPRHVNLGDAASDIPSPEHAEIIAKDVVKLLDHIDPQRPLTPRLRAEILAHFANTHVSVPHEMPKTITVIAAAPQASLNEAMAAPHVDPSPAAAAAPIFLSPPAPEEVAAAEVKVAGGAEKPSPRPVHAVVTGGLQMSPPAGSSVTALTASTGAPSSMSESSLSVSLFPPPSPLESPPPPPPPRLDESAVFVSPSPPFPPPPLEALEASQPQSARAISTSPASSQKNVTLPNVAEPCPAPVAAPAPVHSARDGQEWEILE